LESIATDTIVPGMCKSICQASSMFIVRPHWRKPPLVWLANQRFRIRSRHEKQKNNGDRKMQYHQKVIAL